MKGMQIDLLLVYTRYPVLMVAKAMNVDGVSILSMGLSHLQVLFSNKESIRQPEDYAKSFGLVTLDIVIQY